MCPPSRTYLSCVIVLFFCVPLSAFASTPVTSDIIVDTHWMLDGSPYVIDNDPFTAPLIVAPEATLTIDPGVIVKFAEYNGLTVKGTLHANGTAENPVIFTSLEDDTAGGDTNGDGTDTAPAAEQWMHLQFDNGSSGTFDYTTVRYGGGHRLVAPNTGIENDGGTLVINHTTFTHNGYDGLGQNSGHTTLSDSIIFGQDVGISMNGGVLDVNDTYIHDNAASGIDHSDGALSVTHSEIDHNDIGVVAESQGSIVVSNSSIHDNGSLGIDNQSQIISYDENGSPIIDDPGITVDAHGNWWGDKSGPYASLSNETGVGNGVQGGVDFSSWLTSDPFAPDPCAAPGSCVSNILFLPGIEGSRLYEGVGCGKTAEEKLWEPLGDSIMKIVRGAGDDKAESLFLDQSGQSICSDIYAKPDDIIDSVGGSNIYKSFIDEMNGLRTDGTIVAWKPIAYDWRLSLTDLLNNGAEHDGKIFYEEATSTPYIEQTLRMLATTSKTGKVTIVAHSNGGLVAKALLNRLGGPTAELLVDKVIMVGVPQSGAPIDIGALLYGEDQGISSYGIPILHSAVARSLAQNSPMAYHLLPSEDYLESTAGDSTHPTIRFSGDGYAKEEAAYGATIANRTTLADFLLARDGGREKPNPDDINSAEILNSGLIDYATNAHSALDFWTPPDGVEVDQIAGWGVDTVAGIDFYTPPPVSIASALDPVRAYRPIFTEDGDGTVPVPSALMMASSTSVKRYWINLDAYRVGTSIKSSHADLFEIPSLQDFIKNIIKNATNTLPAFISSDSPSTINVNKRLTFFLHSPLTLQLTDSLGNVTGLAEDGAIDQGIPGSTYGEFGEVKYVTVPEGSQYQLTMHGQANGTFSLDMQESSGGVITDSATIAGVPTVAGTSAALNISGGIETASALTVDKNGDGKDVITVIPKSGEIVSYKAFVPTPVMGSSGGSGGGAEEEVVPSTVLVPFASSTIETVQTTTSSTTESIATSTHETVNMRSVQAKNKTLAPIAEVHKTKEIVPPASEDIPQTASVYSASQQQVFAQVGRALYNRLHEFWLALKKLF